MPGSRHGDVEQAQLLAALLAHLDLAVVLPTGDPVVVTLPADVDRARGSVVRVVEHDELRLGRRAVPEERAVDDGELEALAAVDRQHLHGVGVGLESPAAILAVGVLGRRRRSAAAASW